MEPRRKGVWNIKAEKKIPEKNVDNFFKCAYSNGKIYQQIQEQQLNSLAKIANMKSALTINPFYLTSPTKTTQKLLTLIFLIVQCIHTLNESLFKLIQYNALAKSLLKYFNVKHFTHHKILRCPFIPT